MRRIGYATVLAIFVIRTVVASETAAVEPVTISLAPARLTCSTGAILHATCTVTNTSDQKITLLLGEPRVFLFPKMIVVETAGLSTEDSQKVTLDPGESRSFPVVVTQGREIPLLDVGDYRLRVDVRFKKPAPGGLVEKKAELNITEEAGQDHDRLTANQIVGIAREYSEKNKGTNPQKIDYVSYRIARHINDWNVEFSYRGPDLFGTQTISVNTVTQKADVRPIP